MSSPPPNPPPTTSPLPPPPPPLQKTSYKTPNLYELSYGYSRAIRRANLIFVSGTTSLCPTTGIIQHPNNPYLQTVTALNESIAAIIALGGRGKQDVVRVRLYVTRLQDCDEVGRGMRDVLEGVEWAATMIVGVGLVREEMVVEVEVDAVVG